VGTSEAEAALNGRNRQLDLEAVPVAPVSPQALWLVLHHGSSRLGDSHRFSLSEDPEEKYSMVSLTQLLCVVLLFTWSLENFLFPCCLS